MRWSDPAAWVWSTEIVHEPLIDDTTFRRVQQELQTHPAQSYRQRAPRRTSRPYLLR